ncbi:MAG: hypothetical protein IPL65_15400 [Lewinellaceae bacterium]|nr:hypothetical protein [Lewinellaceae bacterium]
MMTAKRVRQRRDAKQMLAHIGAWEASGMSKAAYYTQHGIPKSIFVYWLRKYRSTAVGSDAGFVEVGLPVETAQGSASEERVIARLRLTGDRELLIHAGASASWLRELLGC